jgi:hypothetical protein
MTKMFQMDAPKRFYLYGIGVWGILGILTISFAIFREAIFIPLSGLDGTVARAALLPVAIVYTLILAYLFLKRVKIDYTQRDTIFIGLMWLVLTIIFEFSFGTFVMGYSLATLLYDYNIFAGRTWGLFLLTTAIAPFVVYKYILKRA